MSILRQRRKAGAVCPKCSSPDYTITPPHEGLSKPNIKCGSCGNTWQYGVDGGIYTENLSKKKEK